MSSSLPAGYIERRNRQTDVAAILEQASQRDAVAIVAGMPYDAHGRSGEQARKTDALVRALQRAIAIPVLTVDESFSSNAAANDLLQSGQRPEPGPRCSGCRRRGDNPASFSRLVGVIPIPTGRTSVGILN